MSEFDVVIRKRTAVACAAESRHEIGARTGKIVELEAGV